MSKRAEIAAAELRLAPLAEALSRRYLNYALSTIMSRSLPDVRDGLKPVHRRLLYAMRQMRLDPDRGYKKCARVVGDVIGRYHPHGDQAVYDAMVRLAQEFSVRYPLVDGQGNFGSIDGDNAAAFRYTEARMTQVATALMEGIDEDAVDFRATYDGEGEEPTVLPANFPNLLANGATGIAVGMATNIPPHNVGEICAALVHLIKAPKATIDKLVGFIPGPDLPTGGVLTEDRETIVEAYRTGRGSLRVRARWQVEKQARGLYQIVITEIPYQVQKAKLVERIAELLEARKLVMLEDVRDESAEDIRLVLEPKNRNVEPDMLMASLFRQTDLETRFGLNMNVLDADHAPRVMSLREILQAFIDHRHIVLNRRGNFRLAKIADRLDVLDGYMVVYLNLDEVIRIIREEDEPKAEFMSRWELMEAQADAILNMRLRSLRRLEEIAIAEEIKELKAEQKNLKGLLKSDVRRRDRLIDEIKEIAKRFGEKTELGRRRTEITSAPEPIDVPLEATIEREPVTIVCSDKGWVRTLRGQGLETDDLKYKEGDRGRFFVEAQTTDKLLVFATNGRFYTVGVDKLPGGRGHGEPLRLMLDLGNDVDIVDLHIYRPDGVLLVAAEDGRGFLVEEKDTVAQTRGGRQVLNVKGDVEARACVPAEGTHVAVIGDNRKMLIFPLADLPTMARGRGVRLQSYAHGGLADAKVFVLKEGLTVKTGDRHRSFEPEQLKDWLGKRAQAGRLPPPGFPRSNRLN
ncbi:MAG: DNA topoisomerase IV subunit A [Alphaproteobacteria bacterium]|nr:DNA topoisomerase IV subunit A [Alphaproteobacteria bacterium]